MARRREPEKRPNHGETETAAATNATATPVDAAQASDLGSSSTAASMQNGGSGSSSAAAVQNGGTHHCDEYDDEPGGLLQAFMGLVLGVICVFLFAVFGQGYDVADIVKELGLQEFSAAIIAAFAKWPSSQAPAAALTAATAQVCPVGYVLKQGDVPGGDNFGRQFENKKDSIQECRADCDARQLCMSFEYSTIKKQCYLNAVSVPTSPNQFGDFTFCSKVDITRVGNAKCWTEGFGYEQCCHERYGAQGNVQCWDAMHYYAKCCFPSVEL